MVEVSRHLDIHLFSRGVMWASILIVREEDGFSVMIGTEDE